MADDAGMNEPGPLRVEDGAIVALRLYDLAYAIDLATAEARWSAHSATAIRRSRISQAPANAVAFDVPPVLLELAPVSLLVDGITVQAAVTARLYDFGVGVFALRMPVSGIA